MQKAAAATDPSGSSTRRQWAFRAVALALGLSVALGMLEIACRVFRPIYLGPPDYFPNFFIADRELGYTMAADFSGLYRQDYEMTYTTNSLSLRDREFEKSAPEGVVRILAVGDSWTFGLGVDLPDTWPKQLENALRERGIAAEVINAGVSGYSTLTYAKVLKKYYPIFRPQAVIVMTCANDPGGDISVLEQNFSFAVKPDPGVVRTFLKQNSHLAMNLRVLYLAWATPKNSYTYMNTLTLRPESDPEVQRGYGLYQEALVDMRDFARDNGIPLIVSAIPMGDAFLRRTREISEQEKLDYVSLETLKGDSSIDGQNSGGHYNPEGYRRMAEILAEFLQPRI